MIIRTHRTFDKQYKKLRKNEKERVKKAVALFLESPSHPLLHNHELKGKQKAIHSINAGGDLRILFHKKGNEYVILITVGSHSQLYS